MRECRSAGSTLTHARMCGKARLWQYMLERLHRKCQYIRCCSQDRWLTVDIRATLLHSEERIFYNIYIRYILLNTKWCEIIISIKRLAVILGDSQYRFTAFVPVNILQGVKYCSPNLFHTSINLVKIWSTTTIIRSINKIELDITSKATNNIRNELSLMCMNVPTRIPHISDFICVNWNLIIFSTFT